MPRLLQAQVALPERARRHVREGVLPRLAHPLALGAIAAHELVLALADGTEARPVHVADGPLGARGVQEHDGPAARRAALERRGAVLDHVAGTAAEQGTGQVVLVVGQRAPQLHEARGAELQARVGEHPVGHARRAQQRGVELLHGDELLVARAVGRHEGRPVEGLQVLGALEVVLEAVE